MNGWIYIENFKNQENSTKTFDGFEELNAEKLVCLRQTDGRFFNDKVFKSNENLIIILEGVLLNLTELKSKYGKESTFDLLSEMYCQHGEEFITELRGPFSGVLIDKKNGVSFSFVNQTGDMPAYFYCSEDYFVTASDFNYIVLFLKENNIQYSFNNIAARHMITFGHMIDNNSIVDEIKRILPGKYIRFENGLMTEKRYYKLKNSDTLNCNLQEAVELIDIGFRKAIKRCFDKDLEYGYKNHLVDISGGLDSRMTTLVAKEIGYTNITNISYSQSSSEEYKITKEVSHFFKNDFIHKQLDDALFIFDIDEVVKMNYGAGYYVAITGGNRFLSDLNFRKFGLEHTGQLGDVVLGTYNSKRYHYPPDINSKRSSKYNTANYLSQNVLSEFENNEIYVMNTRGFLGILNSHFIRKNYTYAVSPFIDIDFINLCFSIPIELRFGHKLYFEWIKSKYPDAANLQSTRKQDSGSLLAKNLNYLKRVNNKINHEMRTFLYNRGLLKSASDANHMNPFDYWYETIPEVKKFINEYYEENFSKLKANEETKMYIKIMFRSPRTLDKLMALTVLAINKCYFE